MLEALIGAISFVVGTMIIMGLDTSVKPPKLEAEIKNLKTNENNIDQQTTNHRH